MTVLDLAHGPFRKAAARARPRLRGLARPVRRVSRLSFAGLVVLLLAAGTVGLLLLNISLQDQAFAARAAQRQATELGYRLSDLQGEVNRANSPALLARRASELGMVPNPNAVFLDLASGQVLGKAKPVTGTEFPSLKVLPAPSAAPSPTEQVKTSVVPWFELPAVKAGGNLPQPQASAAPKKANT